MSSATLLFSGLVGIWILLIGILIWAKQKAPRNTKYVPDPNAGRPGHNFDSGGGGDIGGH